MGGGIINLKLDEVTAQTLRLLRSIPGIKNILTISPEKLRLIVEDTGQVLKEVVSCFQQNDLEIQNIEPYRPDFEEVFVRLLENDTGLEKDLEEKEPLLPDQSLPVSVLAHLEKGALPADFPHLDPDTRKETA
jgi:hypothetical protein